MKKLCLFLISFFWITATFAQTQKGYVYLKNGTILKGKYQYTENGEKIKLQSAGNLWVFSNEEIDTITSVSTHRLSQIKANESQSQLFYRTEIGFLAGNSENSQSAPFSFQASGNYNFTPHISAGAGFGAEFLKETYLPVFANFEYKFYDSYSTPYLFVKAGYQIAIEESRSVYYDVYPVWSSFIPWGEYPNNNMDAKGGIMINPGVGYQRFFSSGLGMSLAFGYQFHRLHYKGENDYALDIDYNRLSIKIGIIFN